MKYMSVFLVMGFAACSSTPKIQSPEWTHQPTRIVDNGYIVYTGVATAPQPDRAQFKAEGIALEDLANECSMIPKGTRIEDRFVERQEGSPRADSTAFVKIALEFQECEQAKRALDPAEIRKLASLGFTEQLKKYQDLSETGEMPVAGADGEIEPPEEIPSPPAPVSGRGDSVHFFVVRQYVAYQKEVVVLSPATAYAPGSPRVEKFVAQVTPAAQQVQTLEHESPTLKTQAWSQIPNRPQNLRPPSLAPKPNVKKLEVRPPPQMNPRRNNSARGGRSVQRPGNGPRPGQRGRGWRKRKGDLSPDGKGE